MMPDRLRAELEASWMLPADALHAAVGQAEALAPAVAELAEKAARGVVLMPRQVRLFFFGVHALAAARSTGVYRPLMRILHRPVDELDWLFGGALTETLAGLVVSVFDGDTQPLFEAIEDRDIDGVVRWTLLGALARLTFDGRIARATTLDLVDRFDRDRLAEDEDLAWTGWADVVAVTPLPERAGLARSAWADGRCSEDLADLDGWEERFARACAAPADASRFAEIDAEPIDDPVEALAWMWRAEDDAYEDADSEQELENDDAGGGGEGIGDERDGGEAIPELGEGADARPLDDEEVQWLSLFLHGAQVPETTMSIEALDGFLTALVAGPEAVPEAEYLPVVWGTPDGSGPVFDGREQEEYLLSLLRRHCLAMAAGLASGGEPRPLISQPPDVEGFPEFDEEADAEPGSDWAYGFVFGIGIRDAAWKPLLDHKTYGAALLAPLTLLAPESADEREALTPEERRELIDHLPTLVTFAHTFWRNRDARGERGAAVRKPKIGRNEKCPCGSGKKYKLCCGR